MYITLTLDASDGIVLPIDYNYLVQSAIYHSIDPMLAKVLHELGFVGDGRVFRLFGFSRLQGPLKLNRDNGKIYFKGTLRLVISSPVVDFAQSLANGLLLQGGWRLGNQWVKIQEIHVDSIQVEEEEIMVKTLSPVVVYSTLLRPDGRKYTAYFQPGEPNYNEMITANLRKKYKAYFQSDAPEGQVTVKAKSPLKMNLLKYKGIIIKGYSGVLQLNGPRELLQMAVDGSLGSKNSQGLGCIVSIKSWR